MNGARQLILDLPHREARDRQDFLVSGSNAAAVAAIDGWPDWPHAGLVVVGPEGSGKSHLVEVWRQRSGGRCIAASDISGDPDNLIAGHAALAIEDCGPGLDEPAMFHLLNAAERRNVHLLLTARVEPRYWRVDLADLTSRLMRFPVVTLALPDDALLQAVMVKQFADRQLAVEASVVRYLAAHGERSFAAARDLVARLDRAAVEAKRPVSRVMAARVLAQSPRPSE
jgi:chromosomal replication initiation ATPase DnaA